MPEESHRNSYPFHYLHEKIEDNEDLITGPHKEIAENICSLISEEDMGATIGIEGKWGSGKSTLINLIRKKVDTGAISVVYFDAWAHEGNALRTAFLMKMAKDLDLREFVGDLTQIKSKKSFENVSLGAIVFALFLLLVPLGSALIDKCPILSVIILLLPACIVVLLAVYNFFNSFFKSGKSRTDLGILVNALPETVTAESPDRSSVVFETKFRDIVKEFLSKNDKKIVIVIDNLDRINEDFFLNMWQSLQTFLQFRSSSDDKEEEDFLNKVWFIIPYDAQYLKSIKADTFNPLSFIEKSFQLRYEISLTPITDWAELAKKLIDQATENCDGWTDSDRADIFQILKKTRGNTGDVPTPRQLRLYINQVCLTKRLYPTISVSGIAYYVLLRYSFKANVHKSASNSDSEEAICNSYVTNDDIIQKLISGTIPEPSDRLIFDKPDQIVKELAALACGTPDLEKGTEILLYRSIYNAICLHNPETLGNLKNVHKDAFWTVFTLVIKNTGLDLSAIETIKSSIWEKDNPLLNEFRSKIEAELKKGSNDPIHIWDPLLQIKKPGEEEKLKEMIRLSEPLVEICTEIGNEENKLTYHLCDNLLSFICYHMENEGADEERVKLFLRLMDTITSKVEVTDIVPKHLKLTNLSFRFWATFSIGENIPGYKWIVPEDFNPEILNIIAEKLSDEGLFYIRLYINSCGIDIM